MTINDRIVAMLRGRYRYNPVITAASDDELLQAYACWCVDSPATDGEGKQSLPHYVTMGRSGRIVAWNAIRGTIAL